MFNQYEEVLPLLIRHIYATGMTTLCQARLTLSNSELKLCNEANRHLFLSAFNYINMCLSITVCQDTNDDKNTVHTKFQKP